MQKWEEIPSLSPLMTLREAASWLHVSERTVTRLVEQGKLRGAKVGAQWRFRGEDLYSYYLENMAPEQRTDKP